NRLAALFAAKRPLPPPFFRRFRLIFRWCGVGNVVLERPNGRRGCAGYVLVIGRCRVDLIPYGSEAVRFAGEPGLGMLHAFGLRPVRALASAAAATAAAAPPPWFAILTLGLAMA